MREIFAAIIVVVVVSVSAFAFTSAWTTPVPSASDTTLGENQKREMMKAVETENREHIHKIRVFVGYSTQSPAW